MFRVDVPGRLLENALVHNRLVKYGMPAYHSQLRETTSAGQPSEILNLSEPTARFGFSRQLWWGQIFVPIQVFSKGGSVREQLHADKEMKSQSNYEHYGDANPRDNLEDMEPLLLDGGHIGGPTVIF